MKKIFTLALAATAALAVQAEDFVVYEDGALNPGIIVYKWYAAQSDFDTNSPDREDHCFKFNVENGGPDGSMGLFLNGEDLKTGPLHSATLNISYVTEGSATYTVRLTAEGGAEENYSFATTDEDAGTMKSLALSVAEKYPTVSQQWNDFTGKGAGYIFSIIAANASADAAIYFTKISYSDIDEEWTSPELPELPEPTSVPEPTPAADDVVSIFGSSYPQATTFNIGSWGQTTRASLVTIEDREAYKVVNFNYLGWEFAEHLDLSDCETMHVDFFACEETGFGFTPISPNAEKAYIAPEVNVGEWNSYDVPLTHWDNVNFADIYQIKFDQGANGPQGYISNVYFVKKTDGIENIIGAEAAPARYFRLDGVEMQGSELPAGLYIMRQGEKASKVLVR